MIQHSRRSLLFGLLAAFRQDTRFSTDVKVVNVYAAVRDKKGQIVSNLAQDDFLLSVDGRPETIRYFARESDLPLTLGLLIDTSGSQRRLIPEERKASYHFFDQVLREAKDQAFVIHFDREAELLRDLTSSRKLLEASLEHVGAAQQPQRRQPGAGGQRRTPGTVLYDSILLASDELMKKQAGRKALVLLTDGVDNGSKVSIERAIEAAQRADTLVYSILFADEEGYAMPNRMGGYGGRRGGRRGGGMPPMQPVRPDGKKVLRRISKETGGGFFEVSKKHPLDKIYDQIQEELRNQYSIGFTPGKSDGNGLGIP